jgi:hypothetical protein
MNKSFLVSPSRISTVAILLGAMLVGMPGCASTKKSWKFAKNGDFKRAVGLKSSKPLPPEVPARLVSTWTDTVLQRSGKPPQRGFGGRLVFFTKESEDPVRVDGQLVIYAFDETDREPHETHPSRKYIFPREEFARHESDSQLGSSYSVWLPWDEVGGDMKQISLIARFEPHSGNTVLGEQTKHLLPGISKNNPEFLVQSGGVSEVNIAQHTERPTVRNVVQQMSADIPADESTSGAMNKAETKSSTTTIALPKKWERRLSTQTK